MLVVLLAIIAFTAGFAVMYWLRDFFARKDIIRSSALIETVKEANEMATLRSYFQHVVMWKNTYDYNKIRDIVNQERSKLTQEAQEKLAHLLLPRYLLRRY